MTAHNLLDDCVVLSTSWVGKDKHLAQCCVVDLV